MRITLVADVPDQAIIGRIEYVVQRDGEFHHAQTRTEILTDQRQAALRSLIELTPDVLGDAQQAELYFSPEQPADTEDRWIKTIPRHGWFVYLRIYGPDAPPSTAPGSCPTSNA